MCFDKSKKCNHWCYKELKNKFDLLHKDVWNDSNTDEEVAEPKQIDNTNETLAQEWRSRYENNAELQTKKWVSKIKVMDPISKRLASIILNNNS